MRQRVAGKKRRVLEPDPEVSGGLRDGEACS